MATLFGGRARRGTCKFRQAREVAFVQHQRKRLFVGEHVLTKLRAEARQAFVDRREAILCGFLKSGAGTNKSRVITLENPRLFSVKVQRIALRIEIGDPAIKGAIEMKRIGVPRKQRRNIALDRLYFIRRMCAGQYEE